MFATLLLPHVLVSALLLCVLPCFSALASAQQTFFPPEWPLAVRSPYLSSWEAATKGSQPPYNWPKTSTEAILGWQGLVNIDGVSYNWLGDDLGTGNSTNLTNVLITPTRTVLSMTANTVDFNITFLSPIEASSPNDFVRQSIPFSYIYFEATSRDGNSHSIQVYSDISAEWSSGNRNDQVQWTTTTNNANSVYHSVNLISQTQFEEEFGQAEWGTLYYGIKQGSSITYRTSDASSRNLFRSQGKLDDSQDNKFRAINNSFPVFALSQDLGTIKSTSEPVVWMVGYSRDPAIRYIDLSNVAQDRSLYFQSAYSSLDDVISAFATDFSNARGRAEQLDARLISAANAISSDYADLLSIAARQVYGATELTIAKGSDGQFNKSDVMMFMRNIGGGDSAQRVNPVEILYQAFPMFMYLDPTLGAPLLEPLLRFQDSSKYQNPYAAQDVGANYPIAQGDSDGHPQRVEQTANMIIMAAALARTTGDGSLINRYYPLFVKWTDFLSSSTLFLTSESSADLDTTANQTNLAVKGIIAIKAMSDLSSALGHSDDATRYATVASNFTSQWHSLALSAGGLPYMLGSYGNTSSFSFGYNLYADKWLGTNIVNSSVYDAQTNIINLNLGQTQFGLPIDSSNTLKGQAVSSWNLFEAAFVTDTGIRNRLISMIRARASFNATLGAFPAIYDAISGAIHSGIASPAQGSMFAPLALNLEAKLVSKTIPTQTSGPGRISAGAIAGGVVGGIVLVTAVIFGIVYFLRRRRNNPRTQHRISLDGAYDNAAPILTPFEMSQASYGETRGHRPRPSNLEDLGSRTSYAMGDVDHVPSVLSATTIYNPYSSGVAPPAPYAASASTSGPSEGSSMTPASRKRSEALGQRTGLPPPPSANLYTREDPSTSRDGLIPGGPSTGQPLDEDTLELRTQVEVLRREMESLRQERGELPPRYAE